MWFLDLKNILEQMTFVTLSNKPPSPKIKTYTNDSTHRSRPKPNPAPNSHQSLPLKIPTPNPDAIYPISQYYAGYQPILGSTPQPDPNCHTPASTWKCNAVRLSSLH